MIEPIYTIDEVTEMLKLKNSRTVQGWLKEGKMRGFKAGKEWRVTESALNEFIHKGGGD
jgi:excisionase family DNA binding protein